jgi:hypothetical protein
LLLLEQLAYGSIMKPYSSLGTLTAEALDEPICK